jgi:catechol 2,3-dioxygenase-like lactoylglutathione lyase family enzyme
MVTGISIVAVPVDDIDEALRFFCDVLGMEKRKDLVGADQYAGERYVEVAPPGSAVALSPYTNYTRAPGNATIGEYSRMVLRVDDVRRAHRELSAAGVQFEIEPLRPPARHLRSDPRPVEERLRSHRQPQLRTADVSEARPRARRPPHPRSSASASCPRSRRPAGIGAGASLVPRWMTCDSEGGVTRNARLSS